MQQLTENEMLKALLNQAIVMRKAQSSYYLDRNSHCLQKAKEAEHLFDRMVKRYKQLTEAQQTALLL